MVIVHLVLHASPLLHCQHSIHFNMAFLLANIYTRHFQVISSCLNIREIHVPLFLALAYESQSIIVFSFILWVLQVCIRQFCRQSSELYPKEGFVLHMSL